jgi:hypothetical protein
MKMRVLAPKIVALYGALEHKIAIIQKRRLLLGLKFRYLGTRVTNQNLIQEEITSSLNSGNAC